MVARLALGCLALLVPAASGRRHDSELDDAVLQPNGPADARVGALADLDDDGDDGSPLSAAAALLAAEGHSSFASLLGLSTSEQSANASWPWGPTCDAPTCSLCSTQTGCGWCPGVDGTGGSCQNAKKCTDPEGPITCMTHARQDPSPAEPDLWFLTAEEIAAARHGQPWKHTSTFTTGNTVQLLQSGSEVFGAFHEDIEKAGKEDFALVSNFAMDLTTPLVATQPSYSLMDHFAEAMARDTKVRVLLRRGGGPARNAAQQRPFLEAIPKAADKPNAALSQFVNDGRNDVSIGSIHQKFSIVKHSGRLHAMIGGVDFSVNRWDTVAHNEPQEMKTVFHGKKSGWVDRHVRIQGPAAADVANSFAERWNSKVPLRAQTVSLSDMMKPMGGGSVNDSPYEVDPRPRGEQPYADPKVEPAEGSVAVQMLYTNPPVLAMGNRVRHHFEYAPKGDFTYLQSYLKAIRRSAHHIYIEDQYAVGQPEIFAEIAAALERGLEHVTVVYPENTNIDKIGCRGARWRRWHPLKELYPERVRIFVMNKPGVLIHSKMFVIDDVWIAIGSANLNQRSFTFDPELGVAMVDTTTLPGKDGFPVAKLAHETRVKSMSELARVPQAVIESSTYAEAVEFLKGAASMLREREDPEEGNRVGDLSCSQMDPDARKSP